MKQINEYSEKDLLKLQNEDVERIIKLELANNGIKMVKKPVEPTYHPLPEKDTIGYTITNVDYVFEKKETAEEVARVLKNNFSNLKKSCYNWSNNDHLDYLSPLDTYTFREGVNSIQILENKYYSGELYEQLSTKIKENSELKSAYEKAKKEYDESMDIAEETINFVWEKVNEAKRKQDERESMLEKFKEYLDLADNNNDIAWKFMNKAYSLDDDQINYIKANTK